MIGVIRKVHRTVSRSEGAAAVFVYERASAERRRQHVAKIGARSASKREYRTQLFHLLALRAASQSFVCTTITDGRACVKRCQCFLPPPSDIVSQSSSLRESSNCTCPGKKELCRPPV